MTIQAAAAAIEDVVVGISTRLDRCLEMVASLNARLDAALAIEERGAGELAGSHVGTQGRTDAHD